jgi:dienelactone hydrolase
VSRDGISLKFLAIKAIDGFQVDAALWQPSAKPPSGTTLVVMVHGSGGSYQRGPESSLGWRLASTGYAALAISTRQHDDAESLDLRVEFHKSGSNRLVGDYVQLDQLSKHNFKYRPGTSRLLHKGGWPDSGRAPLG